MSERRVEIAATSGDHWHVKAAGWLRTLPASEAAALRQGSATVGYTRGQPIFGPSREPQHVYLLEDGSVRLYRLSADGDDVTLGYVRPGELFGEVAVLADRPRESFAECRTRARVLRIPRAAFVQVVRANPAVLFEVTKRIGARLLRCQSRVEDLVFRDARARLAHMLVRLEARSEAAGGRSRLALTQEEMARLVGITRQTVNGLLGEFAQAGLVERAGRRLRVADPAGLRAIAGTADALEASGPAVTGAG